MTVLFLIENAGGGGAESFVSTLAEEYIRMGHSCVLCCSRPGPLSDKAKALGMETVSLALRRKDLFGASKALARICREKNVDVIHAQFPRENVIAARAAGLCPGVRAVYTDHMSVPQGLKWRVLNRIYCRRNSFIAAVWEGGRSVLIKNGVPAEKIRVIPNSVSLRAADTAEALAGERIAECLRIPDNAFVICSLMRLSPEKGPDVLIDAVAELKKTAEQPFFCVIAGDGPLKQALQDKIDTLGLDGLVRLAGRQNDAEVTALLKRADLYVNSSRSEALSMAVLEAMACGLPQVLTRVGAAEEIGCGLLVPPEDPGALAAAIKKLMEDSGLRMEISEKSLEAVRLKYSSRRMAQAYINGGENDR